MKVSEAVETHTNTISRTSSLDVGQVTETGALRRFIGDVSPLNSEGVGMEDSGITLLNHSPRRFHFKTRNPRHG